MPSVAVLAKGRPGCPLGFLGRRGDFDRPSSTSFELSFGLSLLGEDERSLLGEGPLSLMGDTALLELIPRCLGVGITQPAANGAGLANPAKGPLSNAPPKNPVLPLGLRPGLRLLPGLLLRLRPPFSLLSFKGRSLWLRSFIGLLLRLRLLDVFSLVSFIGLFSLLSFIGWSGPSLSVWLNGVLSNLNSLKKVYGALV